MDTLSTRVQIVQLALLARSKKKPPSGFLALLSSPARNTLLHHGIDTIQKLSTYTEKEILSLHGIGKASLPTFKKALESEGLTFKQKE